MEYIIGSAHQIQPRPPNPSSNQIPSLLSIPFSFERARAEHTPKHHKQSEVFEFSVNSPGYMDTSSSFYVTTFHYSLVEYKPIKPTSRSIRGSKPKYCTSDHIMYPAQTHNMRARGGEDSRVRPRHTPHLAICTSRSG